MSRTYGKTRNCNGCRFWSEMIAQANGGGVEALCLSDVSPLSGKYTPGWGICATGWKSGHHGAVDDPPNYGEHTRALYDAEEA